MNNQATPAVEVERHSATTLRFATGDLAQAQYVDAKHLDAALARIAELESDQHQGPPANLALTSMLNLGWSAADVVRSITDQGPLYRKPPVSHGDTAALRRVYDVFGLDYSHHISVLLANVENTKRFSDYLHAVEREFLMVPGEPSEEPEDAGCEPDDECLVNRWGAHSTEHYVEQFRTALLMISKPAGEPVAYIQFGEADSGEIGDYEIEPNRKVCDALNEADNGNGTIYDLHLFPHQAADKQ